jgi:hypothetical protein
MEKLVKCAISRQILAGSIWGQKQNGLLSLSHEEETPGGGAIDSLQDAWPITREVIVAALISSIPYESFGIKNPPHDN